MPGLCMMIFIFFLLQARVVHLHLLCSRPGLCMMTIFLFFSAPGQGCAFASVMLQAKAVHDDFFFVLLQTRAVHLHLLCCRPGLCMMTFFFFAPGQGCACVFVMLQARAVHDGFFF